VVTTSRAGPTQLALAQSGLVLRSARPTITFVVRTTTLERLLESIAGRQMALGRNVQ
jgi:hypothetical protein